MNIGSRVPHFSLLLREVGDTLFTDDMTKLGPQLGAEVSKTSALEINQASSIGLGTGLGL
jgi:hypothetical protein